MAVPIVPVVQPRSLSWALSKSSVQDVELGDAAGPKLALLYRICRRSHKRHCRGMESGARRNVRRAKSQEQSANVEERARSGETLGWWSIVGPFVVDSAFSGRRSVVGGRKEENRGVSDLPNSTNSLSQIDFARKSRITGISESGASLGPYPANVPSMTPVIADWAITGSSLTILR